MGQEVSSQIDESTPPQTLSDRSLEAVAQLILDGKVRRIVALTGAGISTAAGIPDFRSPGTGLYANLQRLKLPYAEAVFSIDYFRENPHPFYILAKELYPGQFHPTVAHAFLSLLAAKGLLRMLFTQNIDCLERAAGVPADLIVEAHGSFATQRCINFDCRTPFPDDEMREHVRDARVPRCKQPGCGALVKPDIVFFGESLPQRFHEFGKLPATDADLVLVLGTSLTVYPFAGLPTMVPDHVPRVLFNREVVGDLGTRADDVLELGNCTAGVLKLADALGWRAELDELWRTLVGAEEVERQRGQEQILATAGPRPPSESSDGDSDNDNDGDMDVGRKVGPGDDDDTKYVGGEFDDTNDQPPEIGGALSSAEAEVNEIANEIEAILKLDESGKETDPPSDDATSTEKPTADSSKTSVDGAAPVESTKATTSDAAPKETEETAPGKEPITSGSKDKPKHIIERPQL
ncbi:sir2 family histone deacetylase [Sporothrix brasiliensis 5110]|uniref:Sir2 family histone deacetylase n=1 Tax=Sporothrix brasiliensis 5110 TaxID=1398154 RepID=A0A0C2IRF5_9PEZI|nr:sir2 family histone deacetylase [Sporothrix brasiliensis 5110]KIH91601.1 sir2 family histone deacetylase [Sporothrix brasiliensis 5110]